jgi:hypothetical protein
MLANNVRMLSWALEKIDTSIEQAAQLCGRLGRWSANHLLTTFLKCNMFNICLQRGTLASYLRYCLTGSQTFSNITPVGSKTCKALMADTYWVRMTDVFAPGWRSLFSNLLIK